MHLTIAQAVAAERVREWHDHAARQQLASQAWRPRRARRKAGPAAAELLLAAASRKAAVPVRRAVSVPGWRRRVDDDCQPTCR